MKITGLLQKLAIACALALTVVVFLAGKEVSADTPTPIPTPKPITAFIKPHDARVNYTGESRARAVVTDVYNVGGMDRLKVLEFSLTGEEGSYSSDLQVTDPGTYTIYWRAETNESVTASGCQTLTILLGELFRALHISNVLVNYHESYTVNVYNPKGATIVYSLSPDGPFEPEIPVITIGGEHTVYYHAEREFYEPCDGTFTITLSRDYFYPDLVRVQGYTGVYDGEPHSVIIQPKSQVEGATVLTRTYPYEPYQPGIPSFYFGNYTIEYLITSYNYRDYTGTVEFNVSCATMDDKITATGYTGVYDGEYHSVNINLDRSIAAGASIMTRTSPYESYQPGIPSFDYGNYTIEYLVTKDYYVAVSGSVEFSVSPASMEDKITATGYTGPYDRQPHGISFSVDPSLPELSYSYSVDGGDVSYEPPTFTEPGTYTVRYTATHRGYNDVTGEVNVVIIQSNMEDNVIAKDCVCTYNGGEHGIDIRVVGIEGATIWYSYSEDGPYTTRPITSSGYGLTRVYYKVTKPGYIDVTGSRDIRILVPESPSVPTEAPQPVITAAPVISQNEEVTVPDEAGQVPEGPAAKEPSAPVSEPELPFIPQSSKMEVVRDQVTISWDKVENADRYVIYGAKVGDDLEKLAEVSADGELSFTLSDMGADAHKLYVYAYYGEHLLEKSTKMIVYADNGSKTNAVSVTFEEEKIGLKVGETKTLEVTVKAADSSKKLHDTKTNPQLKFYSTNESIVSVDKNGKLTAHAKGECEIYAVALSGASDIITVTVK